MAYQYNTDLEKRIFNQYSAIEVEHITITIFLLGFFDIYM